MPAREVLDRPHVDPPTAEVDRSPDPVVRWLGLWDTYFGLSYLITTGLLFTSESPPGHVAGAITALTLIVPWYAAFGRPLTPGDTNPRRSLWYALGLILLFVTATTLDLASAFALFAICPMLLMSLPTTLGIMVVLLANLIPLVLVWITSGELGTAVLGILPTTLLGIALAVLLGLWITRVVEQSRERATLIQELQLNRKRVAHLSRQAGIAAERERLAREIHDTLAQGLTSIITLIQAAESELDDAPELARRHLGLAARSAAENLTETRDFVAALTPVTLRENSLGEAVRRQGDALAAETGLTVRHAITGTEFPLPTAVAVVLLRTAQEALANIRKHAHAQQASLQLDFDDTSVRLVVDDDGSGFEPNHDDRDGYGLRGMRARVDEIGGAVTVSSAPGRGTVVEVVVPLGPADGSTDHEAPRGAR
ncbi:histidine kinase [Streptacidiphilus sp. MAP12-16]|uniref:histidine kinase n=1 Tax=Streptacidiphilus sp. MAP12-16 TaxID=3156300 RepID=UPI003518B09D